MLSKSFKKVVVGTLTISMIALGGCASIPDSAGSDPKDPWEALNRQTFAFNSVVDAALIKPVAKGYKFITPEPVRTGITNAFANAMEPSYAFNNVLQGKVEEGILSLFRLMINSTVGVFGVFDVAKDVDIPRMREDFGQTLGVWGVSSGPYLVLPIIGPSTVRDGVGLGVQVFLAPIVYVDPDWVAWTASGIEFVNLRADLLPITDMLELAVDPYVAARDAFLQQRAKVINDARGLSDADQSQPTLDPFAEDEDQELP